MSTHEPDQPAEDPAKKSLGKLLSELRPGDAKALISSIAAVVVVVFGAGVGFERYFLTKTLDENLPIPDTSTGSNSGPAATTVGPESSGALIVKKRTEGYVMLGVLHIPQGRGIVFSPPAGGTEDNESPTDTAIRETLEETGFTLKNVRFLEKAPAGNTNFSLVAADIDESVPQQDPHKHDGIGMIWADPIRIPQSDWRFPEQREWIINSFQKQVANLP